MVIMTAIGPSRSVPTPEYIEEERDAVGQRKIHKKIGVQPDLNLRRKRLAARLSQMVTAKPLANFST